jgi:transposase InsO family protein
LRVEHDLSVGRFCEVVGIDRSTYYRRRDRERRTGHARGPWPAPERQRIEQPAAQLALEWPAWGHRKIWALLRADGIRTSQSTVLRALAARGLIQAPGVQRERRELARQRREAFIKPVTRRNRVWQMDFSEFETAGQGVWNLGGIVDYAAKVALGCPISATKTARDAIAALECARDRAGELLGRPLFEDCTDPESGELVPLILVTDNGSCFRAADFARHLRARPEFRHVRTRVRSPQTNGQIERFFGAAKYEHLYRHEISDGLDLDNHVAVFVADYNNRRPHEAIDFQLPIDAYLTDPITPIQTRQHAAEA